MSNLNDNARMANSLEKRGFLDLAKAYMRAEIYNHINKNNSNKLKNINNESKYKNYFLLLRLCYSIIIDFLEKLNLENTKKVLNSEINNVLNTNEKMSDEQMNINLNFNVNDFDSNNNLFLDKNSYWEIDSKPFSLTYLFNLIKFRTTILHSEKNIQTVDIEEFDLNDDLLKKKIEETNNFLKNDKKIDEKYEKLKNDLLQNNNNNNSIDNRFILYKDECDKRYKENLENEMKLFKNSEITKIRIEENKKYNEQLEKIRSDFEEEYSNQKLKLNKIENEIKSNEIKLKKDFEQKENENRILLNNKLNEIKQKEYELNKKLENEINNLNIEKEKVLLQQKENEFIKQSNLIKFKNEIEKFKNDYKKSFDDYFNKEKIKIQNEKEKMYQQNLKISKDFNNFINVQNINNFEFNKELNHEIQNLKKTFF